MQISGCEVIFIYTSDIVASPSKRWDEFRRDLRDLWQRIREQHPDPNEVDRCFEILKQV